MLDVSLFCSSKLSQHSSSIARAVAQFLESNELPSVYILDECTWQESLGNEEVIFDNWKRLLPVHLLFRMAGVHSDKVIEKIQEFDRHSSDESSHFLRSLISLHHALAGMPNPKMDVFLLESGAALIEKGQFCPWLALSYQPQHLEFGVYLCALALLTERKDLQNIVLQMAHWQINTLDAEGRPLLTLFTKEHEANEFKILSWCYLFFRAAASLAVETPYWSIAQKLPEKIQKIEEDDSQSVAFDPLFLLMDNWLSRYPVLSTGLLALSEHVYDPSTSLVGYRSTAQHVMCTLHGINTGLGTIRLGDIGIVNYGPQYLPLEECKGFGIEGNIFSDQGMRKTIIEWKPQSFSLKGCAKVVEKSSSKTDKKFGSVWFEVVQEYKPPHFHLQASFFGLDTCNDLDDLVFSFFIKASRCKVQSCVLLPRTLDCFEGASEKVAIESDTHSFVLEAPNFLGKLQVIPLCGGNHFWGADFLVAYHLHSDQKTCQWNVLLSK